MGKKVKNQSLGYLNTGIFPAIVMFSVGFSHKEIVKVLKDTDAKDWRKGIRGDLDLIEEAEWLAMKRLWKGKRLFYIILKDCFNFKDISYCKLAHEVLHICQFVLPEMLERDREIEAEAYLHTHLMAQCLEQIRGGESE